MNQSIETIIFSDATITIQFSILSLSRSAKALTAGFDKAKSQGFPLYPISAPSSPRSVITKKTIASIVPST